MEEKNIRILLQYDGTRYDGWQKQGNTQQTVQGKLEAVLSRLAGGPVEVHGSGRTDAGVHALGQVANFHLPLSAFCGSQTEAADMIRIKNYLNEYLPEDIRVLAAEEARPRFHSRLNALSKTYIYRIETADKNDVFERKYRYGLGKEPDLEIMKRAASILVGTHDFRANGACSPLKRLWKALTGVWRERQRLQRGCFFPLLHMKKKFSKVCNKKRLLCIKLIERKFSPCF